MSLDTYTAGGLLVAASTLIAVIGLLLVRRTCDVRTLIMAHAISGQYLSIVGTMYAVLLGLIVVDAMSRFQQAIVTVELEANSLEELTYLSGRMPQPQRERVQARTIEYAHLVIDREWPMMMNGEYLPEAQQAAIDVMRTIRDWEPVSESEKAVYATALSAAASFWSARRERIVASERGIPILEWGVVILGAMVTVGLTYVFVLDNIKIQLSLTALVALIIALNILLLILFGYPFSGDGSVSPESFRVALAAQSLGTPITPPAP